MKEKSSDKRDWLKHAGVCSLMVRTVAVWDHDRDDRLVSDNLYRLNDNGTSLKSILLLPLLKRMGVNTLLLHQIFPLCKTQSAYDYLVREAATDFRSIDPLLQDKLVRKLDAKEQRAAFLEVCYLLGFRVILEYCPGRPVRENSYYKEHPKWFLRFDSDQQNVCYPSRCNTLPQNIFLFTYALKDFHRSEDMQWYIVLFQEAPDGPHEFESLEEIEPDLHTTIAPSTVDQINAAISAKQDTTIWRMYRNIHAQIPRDTRAQARPYLMQNIIRYDLHPARKPMTALWDYLCENICWYQQELGIDGISLEKPYLPPEKLQRAMAKAARKQRKSSVMIAEDMVNDSSPLWLSKGYDVISGSGACEESSVWSSKFHSFSYRLKGNICLMSAACESYDSRRIASVEDNTAAIILTVMNQFLLSGIPFVMNGVESFKVQSMRLGEYGDSKYLNVLPKEDLRHRGQAYLDEYWLDYRNPNLPVLPVLLEKTSAIRKAYEEAVTDPNACIFVWSDSSRDYGIGSIYIMEDRALLVVCNTNVYNSALSYIYAEDMICELPFTLTFL